MSSPGTAHVGPNLRRLRLAAGLTQAEVAERAGVADATLSRIERGRLVPSVALAGKLADALGTTVDALLERPTKKRQKPELRRCDRQLLALVRDLSDAQVDDVTRGLRLILRAGRGGKFKRA